MSILTRTILAWLLMLAIPVQGFAATAMLFCAPSHHGVVRVVSSVDTSSLTGSDNVSHHHSQTQQSTNHHGASAVSLGSNDAGDHHGLTKSSPIKIGKVADGKCSACAMCCTGSVITSTPSSHAVATTASNQIPFAMESFASYVPEGLDPPPRSLIA
jgi:hypothetical protein